MARIKIENLKTGKTISRSEMKQIYGGCIYNWPCQWKGLDPDGKGSDSIIDALTRLDPTVRKS
ncbi:MAG: hypothetical protein PHW04_07390 [Candidatus Wallbacteria bacterium]|nr:hypothetical protein [Candidatus Wallbacteria bacterium]